MKAVKDGKILLTHFEGSEMEKDASFEISAFYRVKNYVKPEQMMYHHRYRDFAEPYMVAHHRSCGIGVDDVTFNDTNRVFTIQLPYCNLNCKGCYVDRELVDGKNAKYVEPGEILEAFMTHMPPTGVLRISGGEPFLNWEAIILLVKEIIKNPGCNPYLWVDTNLLGKYEGFFAELYGLNFFNIGITACFKGIDHEEFMWLTGADENKYNEQWVNANYIFSECTSMGIDLFFTVPEVVRASTPYSVHQALNWFMDSLFKIHPNLPLRTTVLTWKDYNANKGTLPDYRFESGMTREMFNEELLRRYGYEKVWLPLHQIPIGSIREG